MLLPNLTQAQADELVKFDTDHHTRDMFEAIDPGQYPSWTLKMQIMPFDGPRPTGSTRST